MGLGKSKEKGKKITSDRGTRVNINQNAIPSISGSVKWGVKFGVGEENKYIHGGMLRVSSYNILISHFFLIEGSQNPWEHTLSDWLHLPAE